MCGRQTPKPVSTENSTWTQGATPTEPQRLMKPLANDNNNKHLFNCHFTRRPGIRMYRAIPDFTGGKDDGGGENWSYKTCKASVN